jgi:hypothetical protein
MSSLLHRSGCSSRPRLVALFPALLAALTGLPACFVDVDLGGARLSCNDGECPSGFECVDARCVPEGQGGADQDAGGGAEEDAAPEPDAAPPDDDAAPDDAAPPEDAGRPDAAPPEDAGKPSVCDQQYGEAPGYVLCAEERSTCQFFVVSEVATSCADICLNVGGGVCQFSNDADEGAECVLQEQTGCEEVRGTQVCTCSRGDPL